MVYIRAVWCELFTLGHVYRFELSVDSWLSSVIMEEKQFQALMEEIKKSRKQVEGNLSSSISELKKELTSVKQEMTSEQEKTSRQLTQKISKSSHQFKKKGNEVQYSFNLVIKDSISAVKAELENHPLAVDSDDVKRLEKAEKEAERTSAKHRWKEEEELDRYSWTWHQERAYLHTAIGASSTHVSRTTQATSVGTLLQVWRLWPYSSKLPCEGQGSVSFYQPVVSSAEVSQRSPSQVLCIEGVNDSKGSNSECDCNSAGVDGAKVWSL